MARSENNLNAVFTDTANAIRAKTDTTATICPRDFADKINSISSGGGMKAFFDAGGKCAYSSVTTFDGIINYSDTENVTSFDNMFYNCNLITEVPNVNFSNAKRSKACFANCGALGTANITIPSGVMYNMFDSCYKLTDLNVINTNVKDRIDCSYFARMTNSLQTANLNIPMASNFYYAFYESGVISANLGVLHKQTGENIDGTTDSYGIDYSSAFEKCSKLENVTLDIGSMVENNTSNYITLYRAFCGNPYSTTEKTATLNITFLNADANVYRMFDEAFINNSNIVSLPAVNCATSYGLNTAFKGCINLEELKFYNIVSSIYLKDCTKMTREALVEVLNNLATVTETRKCTLGETNLAKLTDEDKAIATNKGWTLL